MKTRKIQNRAKKRRRNERCNLLKATEKEQGKKLKKKRNKTRG